MANETVSSANFLNGRDTISTKDAKVYATINGQIIPLIECNEFSAKLEKNKEKVTTLGSRMVHKKVTSVEGTGSLGGYLINSNWTKYALPYVQGEKDLYFEITFTISDSTSRAGEQTIQLGEVNLNDIPIADFKADDGVMQWKTDFTFEQVNLVTPFNGLN